QAPGIRWSIHTTRADGRQVSPPPQGATGSSGYLQSWPPLCRILSRKDDMQTHFNEQDLQKPHIREADRVLRTCVHCGFCNATCPTYLLLGDERDGPRGRIYLMKQLLEKPDDKEIGEET